MFSDLGQICNAFNDDQKLSAVTIELWWGPSLTHVDKVYHLVDQRVDTYLKLLIVIYYSFGLSTKRWPARNFTESN